ncbi:TetR/AcrR family transcriptional regulator [Microbispora triticiradicis]|uniref:TetR/AcrR family transcriptional regulator n=3 Tax=Microbispora TaxID=2005 RepID=A0ABY3M309_9ACTN|nr:MULTISPECIES: TetR/AcrR family transcriptional regulator [Microbispora]GLW24914.1 TetR family transcriptional regulator [Microbispora amethystogenes]MBO4270994.1 TetR family transcriptional regulator [Microbispora triticiradicis]RGA01443.1 TetR family transcriptional regulator [Microbispora triticiradicis]TLP54016.1 TetR/AcrR family transcriptional regulator [Microbispora fusca]TYB65129.1 TetR/AcrR family transcriptional regulator [Microbispora tritici]
MDGKPYIAQRPKRADGRRNYDAILAAARKAFESTGADASLEDIASQAGVAIGTLYRHFPTRASLVEAATRDGLENLVSHAERLSGAPDPLDALTAWMREAVAHFSTFRGLVGILARSMYDEGTPSHTMCNAMHRSGADLLRAAQAAGSVRPDLTPDELFDLLSGAAWVREQAAGGRDGSPRFLRLVLEGITIPRA